MLRFLLRRIPRFGFLTLFALMLLFVSVAGWAKSHLDLWREEEALLADLAEKGLPVTYRRSLADPVETDSIARTSAPAAAWLTPIVERFSRIEEMNFRYAVPQELLERAARLPYMRSVSDNGRPDKSLSTESIADRAGIDVTPLPTPERIVDLPPLPRGESVEGEAKASAIEKMIAALDAERPPPPKLGTMYNVYSKGHRLFTARDAGKGLFLCDGRVEITTPDSYEALVSEGARFRQVSRGDASALRKPFEDYSLLPAFDPGRALMRNLEVRRFETQFRTALGNVEAIQVERIDERSCRFDLPPFVLKFTSAPCEDAHAISLIARSDLDWAIESWDVKGTRTGDVSQYPFISPIASLSCRSVLRRERDWIVPESWTVDSFMGNVRSPPYPDEIRTLRLHERSRPVARDAGTVGREDASAATGAALAQVVPRDVRAGARAVRVCGGAQAGELCRSGRA